MLAVLNPVSWLEWRRDQKPRLLRALMAAAHLLSGTNTLADQGGRHMGFINRPFLIDLKFAACARLWF